MMYRIFEQVLLSTIILHYKYVLDVTPYETDRISIIITALAQHLVSRTANYHQRGQFQNKKLSQYLIRQKAIFPAQTHFARGIAHTRAVFREYTLIYEPYIHATIHRRTYIYTLSRGIFSPPTRSRTSAELSQLVTYAR